MEQELDSISSKLLKYYLTNNKSKDFRWFGLFEKINKLSYHLPTMRTNYEKDLALATIMTYIEQQFRIPLLKINLINWLQETNYNNFIFNIYTKLSDLRSI